MKSFIIKIHLTDENSRDNFIDKKNPWSESDTMFRKSANDPQVTWNGETYRVSELGTSS